MPPFRHHIASHHRCISMTHGESLFLHPTMRCCTHYRHPHVYPSIELPLLRHVYYSHIGPSSMVCPSAVYEFGRTPKLHNAIGKMKQQRDLCPV